MQIRRHLYYSGSVQGVGFRLAAADLARGRGLGGWVRNLRDGRVELAVEGEAEAVERFLEDVGEAMQGYIGQAECCEEPPQGEEMGFRVTYERG